MKQNGVTDDALHLYLFPYSLTHHEMASKFLSKYFPPSMVTKLRNDITEGTFMKRRPEECYDLIENMSAHHNDWDTLAHRGESSSSTTSSSEIAALAQQMIEMRKYMLQMYRSNQQVNYVTPSCGTCGGNSYQPQGNHDLLSYRSNNFLGPPSFNNQNQGAGPSVLLPPLSFSSKEVERDPKTITNQSPDIQAHKFLQMFKKPHFNISLVEALALMPKYGKMLKDLLSDKKLLGLANTSFTKNWLAVLLKKLPEKLGDPRKFLIPCDFLELEKCMALADLANRSVTYPTGIAEDVYVQVGKFTFPADFVVIDYDVDPRVPLILGRPFLRTARALVDVYGEELILRDGDENLIFHADNTLKHPQKHGNESINMINFIDITCEDHFPEVLKIKKSNHPLSGSTTPPSDSFPSLAPFETIDSLLEEFADELALFDPFLPRNEDDNFDPEVDLIEIEYLLNRDPSTDSSPTTDIDIIDPILKRFTDEPALVYSSPSGDDDDDLFDFKSDNEEWKKLLFGDHFNDIHSGKDKIKDSKIKILIDELESPESNVLLPLLPASDSTLPEESSELSEIATLLSSPFGNKDKVFNPCILILGGTQIFNNESKDKDLKVNTSSEAFLILKERNFLSISSDQELLFHLELTVIETLLSFSS
ncbi:reverse transcriptase domain-containing protein [Tanacetum coccineum]|uniref:Reverse transcriptase domain-containing protein n=1 Tax=Tanacetum coccineum TaxID=301880 RepID=A0ABQ5AKK0_9ASTR